MFQKKKFRDAVFVVTEEHSCPIYNKGEKLGVEGNCVFVPEGKPVCMILTAKLVEITTAQDSFQRFGQLGTQKAKFKCAGCTGIIGFEYKKKKDFSTLQMKLLSEAEERRRKKHLDRFYGKLRNFQLFESLDDGALYDLAELMELKTYPKDKVVLKQGDPGANLFALLAKKSGHFSYTKGISIELKNAPPFGGFMGLIMEGVQRADEQEYGQDS